MGQMVLNQGLNTAADRSFLAPGELQNATGAFYRPGDTVRLWKILGRTSYGDAYAATSAAQGIAYFAFDTAGTDRIVVLNADGELHASVVSATDSATGSFSTLTTGLDTGSGVLSWAHFNDRWFLCNSLNVPLAFDSDGSLRRMGMEDPETNPICTPGDGTYTDRVTTATWTGSEWSDPELAYDLDLATFAYSWMRDTDLYGDTHTILYTAIPAATDANRYLVINWSLQGIPLVQTPDGEDNPIQNWGQGGPIEFKVKVRIEKSEDGGGTWTTITDATCQTAKPQQNITVPVAADSDQIQVRATVEQALNNPTRSAGFRINDIRVTNEGLVDKFTTTDGLYYAIAEYDEDDNLESPLAMSSLVTFDNQNICTLALPTQVNAHATHFMIYRTHDGGIKPGDFRQLDKVPINVASYLDTFDRGKDSVGGMVAPLLKLQITDSMFTYYPSNTAPEAFKAIVEYQNFLVAISDQFPRRLAYTMPGEPEYWPLLYQILDFPLKEHDELQSLAVAGDLLIVGAREAIIVINGLPELEMQSYASASMTPLRGAPGSVGPLAMTEYSLGGEPRVVWVSEHGIFETNGNQVLELSGDLDWANTVSLGNLTKSYIFYDKADQIIKVGLDTDDDGTPDREFWLHVAEEHRKRSGRPKITGPHYCSVTNQVASLAADGNYRRYSLKADSTGSTFLEQSGGTDAGQFYSGTEVPLDVTSPRNYGSNLREWAVDFPVVRHTSWNNTPLVISWTAGRDMIGESDAVVNTMTISTQGQTKFAVARSGEWHEVQIQHTGNAGTGASIGWFESDQIQMGNVGDTQD